MPTLQRIIEDLEEKRWFVHELKRESDTYCYLQLRIHTDNNTLTSNKFETTGESIQECFENAWKVLV